MRLEPPVEPHAVFARTDQSAFNPCHASPCSSGGRIGFINRGDWQRR
jgi:hypothetical protein